MALPVNVNLAELRQDIRDVQDGIIQDTTRIKKIKKVKDYLSENPIVKVQVVKQSLKLATASTAAGAVLGGGLGIYTRPSRSAKNGCWISCFGIFFRYGSWGLS